MAVAHQALQFRIMRCKQAAPVNAPTLFRFGAFGRLAPTTASTSCSRNERATVSWATLACGATSVFYGKNWMRDHGWDPQGKEFALSIVGLERAVQRGGATRKLPLYLPVYSTPANPSPTASAVLGPREVRRSGSVTDHDFTNSFHYPVWLQPTPSGKLNYEKDFPYYASGSYPSAFPCLQSNPKGTRAVWDYTTTSASATWARTRRSTLCSITRIPRRLRAH